MKFLKPAWTSDDWRKEEKALKEVARENDQGKLAQIAKSAPREKVQAAALEKVKDPRYLADIAKNASSPVHLYPQIRVAALDRISDPEVLADVAKYDRHEDMRAFAVQRLEESPLLWDIARQDESQAVRMEAVTKINDPAVLAEIAQRDSYDGIRSLAVEHLEDQPLLAQIAQNDPDRYVRQRAKEKITDPALLAEVERAHEAALIRIAKTAKDWPEREEAVNYLSYNYELLLDVGKNDDHHSVSHAAYSKLIHAPDLDTRFIIIDNEEIPYNYRCDCLGEVLKAFDKTITPSHLTLFVGELRKKSVAGELDFKLFEERINVLLAAAGEDERNLCRIAQCLPREMAESYGFSFDANEYESEDQYGRYTSSHLYITYQGKTYTAY